MVTRSLDPTEPDRSDGDALEPALNAFAITSPTACRKRNHLTENAVHR
ncbi:hypothetical protein I551_7947 [Mycobacterium ulcerans str. Harvey]|uniref:Uncharacterized protein n=1 Tax=Mycobacterium ulcerans str. Harvey TaxID=1299332 RepID=A0ABN0QLF0_MYCUL|nr:hypothetical protein I551_7947 [Mycobacterium ulcerans str. Harvey]